MVGYLVPVVDRWLRDPGRRSALIGAGCFVIAFGVWISPFALRDARSGDAFDFTRWEVHSVANKWLFAAGTPFRDDPPDEQALRAYFAADDRQRGEAARLENVVESIIEGRIDAIVRAQEIAAPGPVPTWLLGPLAVFPPVDFELTSSPHILVISPRDEIRRQRTKVLRPDLTFEELVALEREAEAADPDIAALVVRTGGIATYPAIVTNTRSYRGTVSTAAHEWVHHYLAFFPLGRSYFSSADARTINETVADIAGDELEALVIDRYGDPTRQDRTSTSAPRPTVDRDALLRDLRLEVDALLADGKIEEAERRMEDVRLELADGGVELRRLNQAYFAWFGTYAARPDAIDPLGPQLREIHERAGSLEGFLALVRGLDSRADVEATLDELIAGGDGS